MIGSRVGDAGPGGCLVATMCFMSCITLSGASSRCVRCSPGWSVGDRAIGVRDLNRELDRLAAQWPDLPPVQESRA